MSKWITDRLPTAADCDENMDVFIPVASNPSGFDFFDHRSVRRGEPWHPKPENYVPPEPPKSREELVQDLLDVIDSNFFGRFEIWRLKVLEAREALR